jgi:Putative DNA-binding domain
MIAYAAQLEALHRAILRGESGAVLPLIARARHNEFPPEVRLEVYTKAYAIQLAGAVRDDYPLTAEVLGKESFEALAQAYVQATPSAFWDLNLYSIGFAEFLASCEVNSLAQDLAAVESAETAVYWSKGEAAWKPPADLTPEQLLTLPLCLRRDSRLLALRHDIETKLPTPTYLLVLRHGHRVQRYRLEPEEHHALTQTNFAAAMDCAHDPEQAGRWLARWIVEGFLRDS